MIENVYYYRSIPHPAIQQKVQFYDPPSNIYTKTDGISIGSSLGPSISDFHLFHTEKKIFKTTITKTKIYVHYVDDIFILMTKLTNLNKLSKNLRTKLYYRT